MPSRIVYGCEVRCCVVKKRLSQDAKQLASSLHLTRWHIILSELPPCFQLAGLLVPAEFRLANTLEEQACATKLGYIISPLWSNHKVLKILGCDNPEVSQAMHLAGWHAV